MKKSWTEIAARILKFSKDPREHDVQFRNLFLKHHRNASEIILNNSGEPLAAVYFTPIGSHQEQTKKIFREIQNRTQYAFEMEDPE